MSNVTAAHRTYHDLELRIRPSAPADKYPVEVSTNASQAAGTFAPRWTFAELDALLAGCELGTLKQSEMTDLGRGLRDDTLTPQMTLMIGQLLAGQADSVRIRLRIEAPELAAVPWEFMQSPENGRFLALSPRITLSRYLPLATPSAPLVVDGPLRVLIACASPSDLPPLETTDTVARIQKALAPLGQQVEVQVLAHCSTDALQGALQQTVHVLHFAGHGVYNADTGQGQLALEDDQGSAQWIDAEPLSYLLSENTVRLLYLDACQTGQALSTTASAATVRPGLGVAQAMAAAGLPAVVAMRFSIPDTSARKFASKFYSALANDFPVDAAMAEGRRAVMLDGVHHWATPMLFMRAPDGQLFARPEARAAAQTPAAGTGVSVGDISGVTGSVIQIGGRDVISTGGGSRSR